jgi:hypothetical protein
VAHLADALDAGDQLGLEINGVRRPLDPGIQAGNRVAHGTIASCCDGDDHCLVHKHTWQIWSPDQSSG